LSPEYRYNTLPFVPASMRPSEVEAGCVAARKRFYTWNSILRRSLDRVNRRGDFSRWNFFLINSMFRAEVSQRDGYPLGDEAWTGTLLEASPRSQPAPPRPAPRPLALVPPRGG